MKVRTGLHVFEVERESKFHTSIALEVRVIVLTFHVSEEAYEEIVDESCSSSLTQKSPTSIF
jgi:hypothetical protein